MAEQGRLILVGHVKGAFGVKGEVRLYPYTDEPGGIAAYGPLRDKDGKIVLTPKRARAIKDGVAITAKEIKTREEAEALKGVRLYVPRDEFPDPEEDDEFYAVDLIGCAVRNAGGEHLGEICAIHDFGAGDILEIKNGPKTWFLPFTAENAPRSDLNAKLVIADPPAELLDPTG
ncbi:MAG TPA: ribosome maturation factor RimM, partial [Caulobacterales bacterium]|nr:ribosome maturation factor RimM [Caulobacterales bacterium]